MGKIPPAVIVTAVKISHTQLETCRRQPKQWLLAAIAAANQPSPRRLGYERALRLAIQRYHRENSADRARQHLRDLIGRHKFQNTERVDEILLSLDSYITWCVDSATITADSGVRLGLNPQGYLTLVGEIPRLDITTDGYRGVLLGTSPTGWRNQLRMPLLQRAIAIKYGRPVDEIGIGIQDLDGSGLQVAIFSMGQIRTAEREFLDLGERVRRLAGAVSV